MKERKNFMVGALICLARMITASDDDWSDESSCECSDDWSRDDWSDDGIDDCSDDKDEVYIYCNTYTCNGELELQSAAEKKQCKNRVCTDVDCCYNPNECEAAKKKFKKELMDKDISENFINMMIEISAKDTIPDDQIDANDVNVFWAYDKKYNAKKLNNASLADNVKYPIWWSGINVQDPTESPIFFEATAAQGYYTDAVTYSHDFYDELIPKCGDADFFGREIYSAQFSRSAVSKLGQTDPVTFVTTYPSLVDPTRRNGFTQTTQTIADSAFVRHEIDSIKKYCVEANKQCGTKLIIYVIRDNSKRSCEYNNACKHLTNYFVGKEQEVETAAVRDLCKERYEGFTDWERTTMKLDVKKTFTDITCYYFETFDDFKNGLQSRPQIVVY